MKADSRNRPSGLRFGDYLFDTQREDLFLAGERVPLQPQPARLLGLFLSRPGELLTKEDIREYIWPDSYVSFEQSIGAALKDIRKALGDDSHNPRFIKTIPRKGYRFVAEVIAEPHPRANRSRIMMAAVGIALLAAIVYVTVNLQGLPAVTNAGHVKRDILVVLPVQEFGNRTAPTFPLEGLTYELVGEMARVAPQQLGVISASATLSYSGTEMSPAQIAEELSAKYILEVSLHWDGPRRKFLASLSEANGNDVLWSGDFDDFELNLQSIQQDIGRNVAAVLGLQSQAEASPRTLRSANSDAYEAYLSGLYLMRRPTADERRRSYEMFRRAISYDPEFAPSYVGLAKTARYADRPTDEIWSALQTAINLDNRLGEAFFERAKFQYYQNWDWREARADFEEAIRLDPGKGIYRIFYAFLLKESGEFTDAILQIERAAETDPLTWWIYSDTGWIYLAAGQNESAREQCDRAIDMHPKDQFAGECLLLVYERMKMMDEAGRMAAELMSAREGANVASAKEPAALTPEAQIESYWRWRLKAVNSGDANQNDANYERALALANLGRSQEAVDSLQQAFSARENSLLSMAYDPRFDPIREDPGFRRIALAVGIPNFNP